MGIKVYKPTTPGRRGMTGYDFAEITRKEPEKSLLVPLRKTGGRNVQGRITCRHIGGGHKRAYRIIDFKRDKDGVPARVVSIEYDPNRTCRIALLHYVDGEKRYIIAPKGLEVGQEVISGNEVEPRVGNAMPLASIPLGMEVHNVELVPGQGGRIVRSAGAVAYLSAKEGKYAHIILPSGAIRKVPLACKATIGQVGNVDRASIVWGKAGRRRHLGIRPTVRGSAMNPVSHPMGGGEGRRAGGRHPTSKWGKLAKGGKTRKKGKPTDKLIVRSRKRGRFQR